MNDTVREKRNPELAKDLSHEEKQTLFGLIHSAYWPVLLDMLERCCIEQETRLINCEVQETDRILAEHKMSKAFWQIFTKLQRDILQAANEFAGLQIAPEPVDEITQAQSLEGLAYARSVGE